MRLCNLMRVLASTEPVQLIDAKLLQGHTRAVEIQNTKRYQRALAKVAGPRSDYGVSVILQTSLVPRSTHLSGPIEVRTRGQILGVIEGLQAAAFNICVAEQGYPHYGVSGVQAWVHGGWKRANDEGEYSVTLRIPASVSELMSLCSARSR